MLELNQEKSVSAGSFVGDQTPRNLAQMNDFNRWIKAGRIDGADPDFLDGLVVKPSIPEATLWGAVSWV